MKIYKNALKIRKPYNNNHSMKFTKMPSKFENNHLGGRVVFPDCRGVSLKMQKAKTRDRAFFFITRCPNTTVVDKH